MAAEVDKVLDEILRDKLTEAPSVPAGGATVQVEEAPVETDWNEVSERLEALRSN